MKSKPYWSVLYGNTKIILKQSILSADGTKNVWSDHVLANINIAIVCFNKV